MPTLVKLAVLTVALCGVSFGQCSSVTGGVACYLDPDVSSGTHVGTPTNPWQTLNWTTINSALASGNVTVYFSAANATHTANQVYTTGISISRSDLSANRLTLDGISFYNNNDSSPPAVWPTNFIAVPCTWKNGATCSWFGQFEAQIGVAGTGLASPFDSNTGNGCPNNRFNVTLHGFRLYGAAPNQIVNGAYIQGFVAEYNELSRVPGANGGPGMIVGPGNNSIACGPVDNVTVQYNKIHDTYGECIYVGATSSDPPGFPLTGSCTSTNCPSGDNYLIQDNLIQSCGSAGGQGDGTDVKDGHTNLHIIDNVYQTTLGETPGSSDGQGILFESGSSTASPAVPIAEGNYIEAPGHQCIAQYSSWNNSAGRGTFLAVNNVCVNINSGVGSNVAFHWWAPTILSGTTPPAWTGSQWYNNTAYLVGLSTGDATFSMDSGGSGNGTNPSNSAIIENNITNDTKTNITAASGIIQLHDYNDCFNATSCLAGETHGITTDPKFVSTTPPYVDSNFDLQSSSGAKGAGKNLSSLGITLLDSDYYGTARSSSLAWDMGFYAFPLSNPPAANPTCTPPGGTFTVPQPVSCSDTSPGSVMCSTQDGTTPATNGTTGCNNGTKYTTTFTIGTTTTLKIIAGGTGYSDSGVVTYLFTISASVPAMPIIWVDNLELSCLSTATCYNGANGKSPALTVPYTAPTYILTLTAGGGSWSPSAPCGLGTTNYTNTKAGMQSAVTDTEACRRTNGVGFIVAYPPGTYSSTAGILIPQSNTVVATTPIILRSTMDSVLAGLPEPVCDGGVQDNIPTSLNIRISNPDCTGQNMYYELAPSNSSGVISGITTLSANTTILSAVTLSGSPQLVPLANGYVSPGNSYIVDSGGSQETVVGVSGVNQVGLYGVFTKNHAAGATVTYDVGNFTLANGKSTNTSAYNYLQYMGQLSCTAVACLPLEFCSSNPGQSPACSGGVIGPDHWEFDDLAISECPGPVSGCVGAANSQFIIKTGFTGSAVSTNSFGSHIHFRRIWCHGDWTSLQVGTNAIADCFDIEGIQYFSIVGSKTSQGLWPGSEGHSGIIQAITGKIVNNVFDCCSSGMFAGGFSNAPFVGYVPFQDIQYGRNLFTFPYTWLGFQYPDPQGSGAIPNSNPYYGGANTPWIVGPTMVTTNGTAVTWSSGDSFHDSTSTWPNNKVTINGVNYNILSLGTGTWSGTCISAPPGTCPTTLTLKTSAGVQASPVTFTMSQPNIVRKNSDEKKEEERVAKYGNTYENVDNSGGQRGICTSNGIRNASGAEAANSNTLAQNYFATINDMYEVGSICRNTCAGRSFDARSAGVGSGNGSTFGMTRVSETDILDYNISFSNPGCPSGNGFDMQTTSGGESWSGNIACNAGAQTCSFGSTGTVFAMDPVSTQTGAITATAVASNVLTVTAANQFQAGQTISFSGLTNPSDTFLNSITVLVIPSGLSTSQFKANVVNANYSVSDTGTATADSIPVGQTSALTNTCLGVACGLAANLLQVNATNNFIVGEVLALGGFTGASSASLLNNQGVTVTAATSSSFQATGITGSYNTETEATGFANGPVGYQVLGMRTADPVFVQGCVTSGINMPTQVIGSHTVASGIAPGATAGNAPWTGSWTASNVQITWPWTTAQGNTGQSDTTGNCVIQNIQSNPQNFSITHATEITDAVETLGVGPGFNSNTPTSGGPPFAKNALIRDNIMLSNATSPAAWYNNALTASEGTKTENFNYDVTSMSAYKDLWSGRTNTNYTEYGSNPFYPDPNGCTATGNPAVGGCNPPISTGMYFPAQTCAAIGFFYPGCSSSVPLNAPDYHYYALTALSPYHNQASDGTDLGAIISVIDAMQTVNLYVPPYPGGSPGPFPDTNNVQQTIAPAGAIFAGKGPLRVFENGGSE